MRLIEGEGEKGACPPPQWVTSLFIPWPVRGTVGPRGWNFSERGFPASSPPLTLGDRDGEEQFSVSGVLKKKNPNLSFIP